MLWRENGIQPHRQGTFKLSRDPDFAARVVDVVSLYLDPSAGAVVLSVDEKTQVQALERTGSEPVSFVSIPDSGYLVTAAEVITEDHEFRSLQNGHGRGLR